MVWKAPAAAAPEKLTIAWIPKALNNPVFEVGRDGAFKKAEELTPEAPASQPVPPPTPPAATPVPQKEPVKRDAPGKKKDGEQKGGIQTPPLQQDTKFQKKCPMCGGRFNRLELERKWQCYTCAYEEPDR